MPPKRKGVADAAKSKKRVKLVPLVPTAIRRANPKRGTIEAWLKSLIKQLPNLKDELYDALRDKDENLAKKKKVKITMLSRTLTDSAYGRIPASFSVSGRESYFALNKDGTLDRGGYSTFKALALVLHLEMPRSDPKKTIPLLTEFFQDFFVPKYINGGGISKWTEFWASKANAVMNEETDYFHPSIREQGWMKKMATKYPSFFETKKILRKDDSTVKNWENYRTHFFDLRVEQVNKQIHTERAVEKQQKPVTIALDKFENIYQQWMNKVLIMDEDDPDYKKLKPGVVDLRFVAAQKDAPNYYLPSTDVFRLGFLLQGCIGSRLKGFALQNKIWEIPFDLSLDKLTEDVSLENPQDELEDAVRTWLNIDTPQRQNLVVVTGLSKQKDKTTILRQQALRQAYGRSDKKRDEDDDNTPDPTLVKPVLDVYLTSAQFMPLFNYYRQVIMFCVFHRLSTCDIGQCEADSEYFSSQYPTIFKEAKKHKKGDLNVSSQFRQLVGDNFALTSAETLPKSYVTSVIYRDIQKDAIKKIQSDLASFDAEIILTNTSGVHILRKMYTVWSYQLYAKRYIKEVAYSQAVLGHKDIGTSLRYTDIIINLPPPKGQELLTYFALRFERLELLVKNIQDAQQKAKESLKEATAVAENARETAFPRVNLRRFTPEEKKKDPDIAVNAVLDLYEKWVADGTWPKDAPFTYKNLAATGIGTALRDQIRRTDRFKRLSLKIFKSFPQPDE
jgi:hypothetical protein